MANVMENLLPKSGEKLGGRYILGEKLGRGGFAVVFRATHTGIDEDVAVKVLLPHILSNAELAPRFEREVLLAKGLRHPNTIRILDFDETDKGLPFYVMEYIRGDGLDKIIEREKGLSPMRTRHVTVQLLKSLAEAHDAGIVHRDLKPENLLLCDIFGESDFVKVLDFGIAKALGGEPGTQTSHRCGDGHAQLHVSRAGVGRQRHRRQKRYLHLRTDSRRVSDGPTGARGRDDPPHPDRACQADPPRFR